MGCGASRDSDQHGKPEQYHSGNIDGEGPSTPADHARSRSFPDEQSRTQSCGFHTKERPLVWALKRRAMVLKAAVFSSDDDWCGDDGECAKLDQWTKRRIEVFVMDHVRSALLDNVGCLAPLPSEACGSTGGGGAAEDDEGIVALMNSPLSVGVGSAFSANSDDKPPEGATSNAEATSLATQPPGLMLAPPTSPPHPGDVNNDRGPEREAQAPHQAEPHQQSPQAEFAVGAADLSQLFDIKKLRRLVSRHVQNSECVGATSFGASIVSIDNVSMAGANRSMLGSSLSFIPSSLPSPRKLAQSPSKSGSSSASKHPLDAPLGSILNAANAITRVCEDDDEQLISADNHEICSDGGNVKSSGDDNAFSSDRTATRASSLDLNSLGPRSPMARSASPQSHALQPDTSAGSSEQQLSLSATNLPAANTTTGGVAARCAPETTAAPEIRLSEMALQWQATSINSLLKAHEHTILAPLAPGAGFTLRWIVEGPSLQRLHDSRVEQAFADHMAATRFAVSQSNWM